MKIVKTVFKKWLLWQRLNWYEFNQQNIDFLNRFYEMSSNFVAKAVFVAKIRIFGVSAETLCFQKVDKQVDVANYAYHSNPGKKQQQTLHLESCI